MHSKEGQWKRGGAVHIFVCAIFHSLQPKIADHRCGTFHAMIWISKLSVEITIIEVRCDHLSQFIVTFLVTKCSRYFGSPLDPLLAVLSSFTTSTDLSDRIIKVCTNVLFVRVIGYPWMGERVSDAYF
jgi:hypothetical protein